MTCIVGLVEGEKVYIGADGVAVAESGLVSVYTDKKLIKGSNFIIGVAGSPRIAQLVRYSFVPPEYDRSTYGDDVHRYIATAFIDTLRVIVGDEKNKEEFKESNTSFLVAFKGRLFQIHNNFVVKEDTCGYDAMGIDPSIALGVLWATRNRDIPPESRVEMAMEATKFHNAFVQGPFEIASI